MTGLRRAGYCIECGALLRTEIVSGGPGESTSCPDCGSAYVPVDLEADDHGACGHCGGPMAPVGAFCRWCGEEIRSAFDAAVAAGRLVPAPFESRWPFSSWFGDGAGLDAPPCPRCGEPVRRAGGQREAPMPGYANLPWNAGWDGHCEMCGVGFELALTTRLHFRAARAMTMRPASRPYRTFIDEGFVLSGVEVTVTETDFSDSDPRTQSLFLSMTELTSIAAALEGSLRIYWDQFDWAHDWT